MTTTALPDLFFFMFLFNLWSSLICSKTFRLVSNLLRICTGIVVWDLFKFENFLKFPKNIMFFSQFKNSKKLKSQENISHENIQFKRDYGLILLKQKKYVINIRNSYFLKLDWTLYYLQVYLILKNLYFSYRVRFLNHQGSF